MQEFMSFNLWKAQLEILVIVPMTLIIISILSEEKNREFKTLT